MRKAAAALGIVMLVVGLLLLGASYSLVGNLQVACTASPYKSIVLTGQITSSTTGIGIQGAVIGFYNPPNSNNNVGGTTTDAGGYYYKFSMVTVLGCDTLGVKVTKWGYNTIQATVRVPDNSCTPQSSSCNSVTLGNNYALVPTGAVTAAFTYVANSLTVTFADKSTGSPAPPNQWYWTFGDGVTSSVQNPAHTYAGGGDYTVVLTVSLSGSNQISTVSALVNVVYAATGSGGTPPPTCPAGYTGTYPNCVPPQSTDGTQNYTQNITQQQQQRNQTANTTAVIRFIGLGVAAVGVVSLVVAGFMPALIFTGPYLHPEDAQRKRRR